jgi:acyl-CoA thioesterase
MPGPGSEFDFDAETRLTAVPAAGTFEAQISDRWSGMASVNGGFLMANCLKALDAVLPFPDPVTVSGIYLRPGSAGRCVIATQLIRSGRTTAFGQASLSQLPPGGTTPRTPRGSADEEASISALHGKEVLRVTAAFADLSAVTPKYVGLTPPKLPDPAECEPLGGISGISMAQRFEYRAPVVPGWMTGKPSGEPFAEFWMRFADGRPADTLTLPLITDAAPPAILELGAGGSTTIELTVHVRARPAPGWLACRSYTRFVTGGYHEEDFEVWDSAGTLVAQSRQLALVRPASR